MHIMVADEADQDGTADFFVYAALIVPSECALELSRRVNEIRKHFGFQSSDTLKFSTGTKPTQVDRENHTQAKSDILDLAAELGCKTICYLVPHSVAKGSSLELRLKFGLNTLLQKFDQFLDENGQDGGIAFVDRTTDYNQIRYLKEVFELGIQNKSGGRNPLRHVVSVAPTMNGLSNLNSVADIVVGSFRWVINEPDKDAVGEILLKQLERLIWGQEDANGIFRVRERGFYIRPRNIVVSEYQADIDALLSRMVELSKR